jgi:hypothetical protein
MEHGAPGDPRLVDALPHEVGHGRGCLEELNDGVYWNMSALMQCVIFVEHVPNNLSGLINR